MCWISSQISTQGCCCLLCGKLAGGLGATDLLTFSPLGKYGKGGEWFDLMPGQSPGERQVNASMGDLSFRLEEYVGWKPSLRGVD